MSGARQRTSERGVKNVIWNVVLADMTAGCAVPCPDIVTVRVSGWHCGKAGVLHVYRYCAAVADDRLVAAQRPELARFGTAAAKRCCEENICAAVGGGRPGERARQKMHAGWEEGRTKEVGAGRMTERRTRGSTGVQCKDGASGRPTRASSVSFSRHRRRRRPLDGCVRKSMKRSGSERERGLRFGQRLRAFSTRAAGTPGSSAGSLSPTTSLVSDSSGEHQQPSPPAASPVSNNLLSPTTVAITPMASDHGPVVRKPPSRRPTTASATSADPTPGAPWGWPDPASSESSQPLGRQIVSSRSFLVEEVEPPRSPTGLSMPRRKPSGQL
jgi:hypothetical protein